MKLRMHFWGVLSAAILMAPVMGHTADAPSSGEQVVVIYNSLVPESKSVAEYYAKKRNVPADQVLGFDVSKSEDVSRAEFRDALQRPLAKELSQKKLWRIASETVYDTNKHPVRVQWRVVESKIRYAVLCYGLPLRILTDPNLKEEGMEKLRPELRKDEACVDSELAVLPLIEEHPPLFSPLRNLLYTATNAAWLHPTNGILLVSRLDGPTPEIAKGLVDKALQAEKDGLWGRAYFDLRNTTDPAMKPGDDWIRNAAELCKKLGFETYVDNNPGTLPEAFPLSHPAYYLGWYDQNVSGPFTRPVVEFMPGAFAYHLHSYSAPSLHTTNQGWVGPFLAKGVTASMGTVHEPYLAGTPDVAVFTSRFIYFGMTFGEAAWAAQPVLSWMTTVVGDPLYRPFGQSPEALQDRFQREHSPLLSWSYLRLINLNLAAGKSVNEVVPFLEALNPLTNSAVLSEKLGDLYFAQGKPSSSAHAYDCALKLGPSGQQRVRLHLTLAERRLGLGETDKAIEQYEMLLKDTPDYPERENIEKRIAGLKAAAIRP